ncbi:hypothetical protein MRB53_035524 [Persea americana]|uniref:Uncharacterized protein n=1 Tax=Persea americana TaxID=3435 RepID=A0ACC2K4W7_PERAE|nr:hypothetical protein MRB53_035524 [Persea americana]
MVMQRGGREALGEGERLLPVNGMSSTRGGRRGRDDGALAGGGGGAVCAWKKKGRRSAGVREMKSRETGEGSAQGVARWRERGPRSRGRGGDEVCV